MQSKTTTSSQTPPGPYESPGTGSTNRNVADSKARSGPLIIALLVFVLLVLHQDNWFWNSRMMVFGFIPIGLFWHACLSVAAALTWALATKIAWPVDDSEPLEETR